MIEQIQEWNLEEDIVPQEKEGIKNEVIDEGNLREYILDELGIKDKFVTGNPDNPILIDVQDLTDKQILNIYKYAIDRNSPKLQEEEVQVINMIRDGSFEDYLSQILQQESEQQPEYSDRDYFYWKMKQDFPDLSDEQIEQEYQDLLDSDTYELKINRIKENFNRLLESQRLQQEQQAQWEEEVVIEESKRELIDLLDRQEEFFNFEIPIQIKEKVLRNIFESDNNETSRFIEKYVDNPQGLLYTNLAVEMLPLIVKEYKILLDELDSLKSRKNFIEDSPNNAQEYPDVFSNFDAESFANYLN